MSSKWDERFLDLAALVATWSKDPGTQCGAVLVRPDRTVASMGFNGFPKGCDDAPEHYADRDLKLARTVHAEMNAILHAKEASLDGYSMYVTHPPCDRCSAHLVQSGITRVVYRAMNATFAARWAEMIDRGSSMFAETGVEVVCVPSSVDQER